MLIYWKKILGLPRILSFLIWIGGIRSEREFRQIELRGFGGGGVDKIKAFCSVFVYFKDRTGSFWRWRQTKFRHFARFLSTLGDARSGFGGFGRQNSDILLRFCLLWRARGPILVATVDKIQAFRSFLSTSRIVRGLFGGGGRQNQGISLVFCLLQGPHGVFLEATVDKIKAFCSVFVYFGDRARPFWRLR